MTRLSFRRDAYLPSYIYDFIELVTPQWTREALDRLTTRTRGAAGSSESR
jgi:hypothetical protein